MYWIKLRPSTAVAGDLRSLHRGDGADDALRLQGPVEHELPRGPLHRGHRLHLRQRRRRQDRDLQDGGAAADQDRRLPGQQADRSHQDRRAVARTQRRAPARLVPRRGRHPPRRGRAAVVHGRKGLHQRRGEPHDHAGRRRPQAGQRHVPGERRAQDQDSRDRLRRQRGDQRQHAAAQAQGEQAEGHHLVHHRQRHLQGSRVRSRRRASGRTLQQQGLRPRSRRPARAEDARDHQGRQDALDPAADSRDRRAALPRRRPLLRGQYAGEGRSAAAHVPDREGRVVQPQEDRGRAQEVAGDLRWRRLHGVHRVSRHGVQRRSDRRGYAGGADPRVPAGPAGGGRRQAGAGGRHHDADRGGRAVLRQPHHLHRQHHHARQRDPPRDAPARGQRLQHRGAQVQRPSPQSAGLLQEPRRQRQGHEGGEDAR